VLLDTHIVTRLEWVRLVQMRWLRSVNIANLKNMMIEYCYKVG